MTKIEIVLTSEDLEIIRENGVVTKSLRGMLVTVLCGETENTYENDPTVQECQ